MESSKDLEDVILLRELEEFVLDVTFPLFLVGPSDRKLRKSYDVHTPVWPVLVLLFDLFQEQLFLLLLIHSFQALDCVQYVLRVLDLDRHLRVGEMPEVLVDAFSSERLDQDMAGDPQVLLVVEVRKLIPQVLDEILRY